MADREMRKTRPHPGPAGNILLLGCRGGVSTALLNLLGRHPTGRAVAERISKLFLIDADEVTGEEPIPWSELPSTTILPPQRIAPGHTLADLLTRNQINQVIELADIDTLDGIHVAEESGADYLCTGYESHRSRPADEKRLGPPWYPFSMIMLPQYRPLLRRRSHLVGSGMNPGIVNALVSVAINRFAACLGVVSSVEALDLYAILFTEEDPTHEINRGRTDGDIFPITWHPHHCLYEVLGLSSKFMDCGHVRRMEHQPHQALPCSCCSFGLARC